MKKYLYEVFRQCEKELPYIADAELLFEKPKYENQGDLSTNIAMRLSKQLKKNPREIAKRIIETLQFDRSKIEKIELAGPGFINFFFSPSYISQIILDALAENERFGRSEKYKGRRANVEFVSANPTGPLTVGHGRNAVCGDTVANLLEAVGFTVEREYYFNNAGRQMRVLGDSVKMRYLQLTGKDIDFPEEYYQGEYITNIAQSLLDEKGDTLAEEDPEGIFKEKAEKMIFEEIEKTLGRIGIAFNRFYNEKSLYDEGKIDSVTDRLREKGLVYEKDGAVWLKLSELGQENDKVIVKSTGEPTYRLPDIAYHETKFERGFDLMVDIFGSDHTATYPDVLAGIEALGYKPAKVKVLINQFVTLIKEGMVVKMSTRKANYVTLDELIDEVGSNVVRYFFNRRAISSHMNFDLDLAKKQSDENPVFYLQYAHARICSIMRMTEKEGLQFSTDNLSLLREPEEQKVLKEIARFAEEVLYCAEECEPHKLAAYLEELAAAFHKFYTVCRIIGSEKELAEARISLILAVRIVLRNGLQILGVSAPEAM